MARPRGFLGGRRDATARSWAAMRGRARGLGTEPAHASPEGGATGCAVGAASSQNGTVGFHIPVELEMLAPTFLSLSPPNSIDYSFNLKCFPLLGSRRPHKCCSV